MTESIQPPGLKKVGDTELIIARLLRVGVVTAASIVFFGGLMVIVKHALETPDYRTFTGEPPEFSTLAGIINAAFSFRARGIVQLGILCLIATPVLRVAFSVYAFARQKDTIYVIVTVMVLSILAYSLFSGANGN